MAVAAPVPDLADRATDCADRLREADRVLLASHIDADGITSAAVASTGLARAGIDHEVVFEKQLDADSIAGIAAREFDVVLFTDFGSGQLDAIADHEDRGDFVPVIADHHQPADRDTRYHLNPLLEGIDGASELSGAGASYLLARALEGPDGDNRDLAGLAVVGAVGDMQDSADGLVGANESIVADGVDAGVLNAQTDLDLYGRQTRPLPKLLEYASDVDIPGISNDEAGAISFLTDLDVDVKRDGEWRRWVDLDAEERQRLASALMRRAVVSGVPSERIEALVGTSYTLVDEEPGTELRDVSEFSTLLNATARYERGDVGLAVCLGDRGDALAEARRLLRTHRRNLSEGLQWVKTEGVTHEDHLQWFDAGSRIRETIVGIVAGMAVGSPAVDRSKPVIAFAEESAEELKVSSRGSHALVRRGLDLSTVMREASRSVGGDGGGHDVAAGATIPIGERDAFLAEADRIVGEQLS
ncbi:RecJ-like exonuclease [Halorubrum ezzemoulense]|uniref:RecJ-like exonuclease n=1 Tax=Halorubrum ezzemoulense TaxID=337243 RepID=A0A238WZC5_HALEZ|nr:MULTISPECIES: DHH family phosphoesterase [Halorubrum]TKX40396.1 DHH family phosphoesterase [Halorubrum sp. CGM4_25_10-8A]TKX64532.1 DHH family phosphoesterase [Halorubrum sp. GN12_10-3_MGM]SNR51731.1 RecJ-like exonuclease [Halorubrum ezzemoulense]